MLLCTTGGLLNVVFSVFIYLSIHLFAFHLKHRVKDLQALGAAETKLLYTLHWILLFAAEECADADMETDREVKNPYNYLFSIPTISVSWF